MTFQITTAGYMRCNCSPVATNFQLRKTSDGRIWAVCPRCNAEHRLVDIVRELNAFDFPKS